MKIGTQATQMGRLKMWINAGLRNLRRLRSNIQLRRSCDPGLPHGLGKEDVVIDNIKEEVRSDHSTSPRRLKESRGLKNHQGRPSHSSPPSS
ncbi:hypothetical protein ANCDUO_13060 [Ancylostoma duodenale]|uniref:Uncharacterized protein n=1 Tax=Ancylostoma duodenale TaxID=51022 RepID=A0A0C2GI48_9BILA|nr:hypothetical protein ANCDUO_13060 [Ancylostoma duodenale]